MLDQKQFPSWMGCVAIKELRQGMRRGLFTIPFAIVHILAILAVVVDSISQQAIPYFDVSALINPLMFFPFSFNQYSCGYLWALIPVICILIIPFIGMSMMSQEMEDGNKELLLLTRLKRHRVVIEKFLAAWSLCLLMLISLLPYTLLPYLLNGMRIFVVGELVISVILYSAVMCAMVIATSANTRILFRILFLLLVGFVGINCLTVSFFKVSLSNGVFWHYLNAIIATVSLVLFSLASAKSHLKLSLFYYEVKPTAAINILLIVSPIIAGILGVVTLGHCPALGYLAVAVLCWFVDAPTKTKKIMAEKKLNIPKEVELHN